MMPLTMAKAGAIRRWIMDMGIKEGKLRNYLIHEKPDAILNIVDGTNPERKLYLTTQLIELGIPVAVGIKMKGMAKV